jgi:hypothetical protein
MELCKNILKWPISKFLKNFPAAPLMEKQCAIFRPAWNLNTI